MTCFIFLPVFILALDAFSRKEFLPFLIITGIAVLIVYPALVLRRYIRIMINIIDDATPNPESCTETGRCLDGEEVSFRATDGHRLEGVIIPHRDHSPYRGLIIFAHEFGSDRGSSVRYAGGLLAAGYDVFAFDFRGHGTSAGENGYRPRQWPSDRERADILGAIAFAALYLEQQGRPREIGIFGLSRGGAAAILAAVGIPEVKAIVTDGAFSSDTLIEFLIRRFATIFAKIRIVAENHPPLFWRFLRWLLFRECRRKFHCRFPSVRKAIVRLGSTPILLIHGEKDSYIPIAQSKHLYRLARGPKELWVVHGARHNQSIIIQPGMYSRRITEFFGKYLDSSDLVAGASQRTAYTADPLECAPTYGPSSSSQEGELISVS